MLLQGPDGIFGRQMSMHEQLAHKRTLKRPITTPRPTNVTQKMSQKYSDHDLGNLETVEYRHCTSK